MPTCSISASKCCLELSNSGLDHPTRLGSLVVPPRRTTRSTQFQVGLIALFLPEMATLGQHSQLQKISDFYGLYYAYENNEDTEFAALVFRSDGRPIPPRANDEDAPTQPGLHIGQKRFAFAWSHF